ncbi:MAG: hypothetical protein NVS9B4_00450 [Candidatus Acidiferrum sp.]
MLATAIADIPRVLAVLDHHGEHLFWCGEDLARELIKKQQVRFIRKNSIVRVLVATDRLEQKYGQMATGRGTAMDKTRYSHDHDTPTNPQNVWTLKHLPRAVERIFLAVAEDCGATLRRAA